MKKVFFVLKLIPPRASFSQEMSDAERATMQRHVQYWTALMNDGKVVAFGPVLDPAGVYGLGIVLVEDEAEVTSLINGDPANGLNRYEYHQMLAVVPSGALQQ